MTLLPARSRGALLLKGPIHGLRLRLLSTTRPSLIALPHADANAHPSTQARLERDGKSLLKLYGQPPVYFSHGQGVWLFDESGRKFLDLNAGIAVNALGHADPDVVKAISEQAAKIVHLSNLYRHEHAGELAEMLLAAVGARGKFEKGGKVFFCNSGTEANEGAFKFARKYGKYIAPSLSQDPTAKYNTISFGNAFHGRTLGSLSATPNKKYQEPFFPLTPGFFNCAYNDIEAAAKLIDERACSVIMEPIQGEGGVHVAKPEFLEFVRKRCDEVGALLIFDEIQAGLSRTGKVFAHHHHPTVTPDIITLAKPLANGIPIGAILVSEHVASIIKPGDHGTTFGGSPLATYVAKTVLQKLTQPAFLEHVTRVGSYFKSKLEVLHAKFPSVIVDVRGSGLMLAMQLEDASAPDRFVELCRERGVLVITAGGQTIRLVPPLILEESDVDIAVEVFESVLSHIRKHPK
ncbi:pyridoxal phosphate-dependent transferase [Cladochytrium replicatum]|nr:pyridoxal phosphate-dependent transferase [Cladochytrium replicatum]